MYTKCIHCMHKSNELMNLYPQATTTPSKIQNISIIPNSSLMHFCSEILPAISQSNSGQFSVIVDQSCRRLVKQSLFYKQSQMDLQSKNKKKFSYAKRSLLKSNNNCKKEHEISYCSSYHQVFTITKKCCFMNNRKNIRIFYYFSLILF